MNRAFDFAIGSGAAGLALKISRATQLDHVTCIILHDFVALDDIGVFQTDFAARFQAEIFWRRRFREIRALDEQLAAKRKLARASRGIFRIVHGVEFFKLTLRIIHDHHFERPKDGQPSRGPSIEFLADCMFEHGDIRHAWIFRDADVVGESPERAGCHPAAAQPGNGWQARIVPAVHEAVIHELEELALAHDGVGEIQPRELILVGQGAREIE